MKLDPAIEAKTDVALRRALRKAKGDQKLRLLIVLEPTAASPASRLETSRPDPALYESRSAYRQAMIEQREAALGDELGPTIDALRRHGLELRGGKLGHVVVVDGPAASLVEGLSLPSVKSATLDQVIEVDPPQHETERSSS